MRWTKVFALLFVSATMGAVFACSSGGSSDSGPSPSQESGPPLEFQLDRSMIPSTGLCRIYYPDRPAESEFLQARGCNGIEQAAQPGGVILYRPRGGSRTFRVCWMSRGEPGVVDGIDEFDVDRMRLVNVIVPRMRRTAENNVSCTQTP